MKLTVLALLLFSSAAFADSFTIVQNGREYLCQSTGSGSPTLPPNPMMAEQCATKAYSGPFSRDESLQLCTGATSLGPADCAIKAYAGPFSRDESLQLCSHNATVANADCAISAYAGPYSRDEALKLCRSTNAPLLLRSLKLLESSMTSFQIQK